MPPLYLPTGNRRSRAQRTATRRCLQCCCFQTYSFSEAAAKYCLPQQMCSLRCLCGQSCSRILPEKGVSTLEGATVPTSLRRAARVSRRMLEQGPATKFQRTLAVGMSTVKGPTFGRWCGCSTPWPQTCRQGATQMQWY